MTARPNFQLHKFDWWRRYFLVINRLFWYQNYSNGRQTVACDTFQSSTVGTNLCWRVKRMSGHENHDTFWNAQFWRLKTHSPGFWEGVVNKAHVQALDLMNCTTHTVQDFTKLLQTNIWVSVVVITTLNYVLDAIAFLTISAILGLTTCLPLELWVPSRSVSCVNWKFHSRSVRRAHFAHSWTVSSDLRLQIRFTFKN